jgi:hypothetical protein
MLLVVAAVPNLPEPRVAESPEAFVVFLGRQTITSLRDILEQGARDVAWVGAEAGHGEFGAVVIAESDELHYDGREFGPGRMHPATEQYIADVEAGHGKDDLRRAS